MINPNLNLDQNLKALHQWEALPRDQKPSQRQRWAKSLPEARQILTAKHHIKSARMLLPMEYMLRRRAQTDVARQIVEDAHDVGIPLVADVEASWTGPDNILVRHYSFGKALSLTELNLVNRMVVVSARKLGFRAEHTLEALRYYIRPYSYREKREE